MTFACKYNRNNVVGFETTVPIWYSSFKSNILKFNIEIHCRLKKLCRRVYRTEGEPSAMSNYEKSPVVHSLPIKKGVPKAAKRCDFMKNHKIKVPEHPEKMMT